MSGDEELRLVESPPPSAHERRSATRTSWHAIALMAVQGSPLWVEVPNVHRQHSAQITSGKKAAFRQFPGSWEVKTRKLETDEDKKATLYIRYIP